MLVRALAALALLVAGCERSPLDTHRAMTEQVLQRRGAPDFADASTAAYAAIRHTPSGMLCVLPADGAFEFDVFPASAVNAGAQCSFSAGEMATGWVAVRFSEPTTLDAAFASGVAQMTNGLQSQVWSGQPSEADRSSPEGLPHYRIHRVEAEIGGARRYLRLAMSEKDGWYLQQIVSAPLAEAEAAERQAGEVWRTGLRAFAEASRETP